MVSLGAILKKDLGDVVQTPDSLKTVYNHSDVLSSRKSSPNQGEEEQQPVGSMNPYIGLDREAESCGAKSRQRNDEGKIGDCQNQEYRAEVDLKTKQSKQEQKEHHQSHAGGDK